MDPDTTNCVILRIHADKKTKLARLLRNIPCSFFWGQLCQSAKLQNRNKPGLPCWGQSLKSPNPGPDSLKQHYLQLQGAAQ